MKTNEFIVVLFSVIIILIIILTYFFVKYVQPAIHKSKAKHVKEPFQFFHKSKLYNFNDAVILFDWHEGEDNHIHSHFVRFPNKIYFRIVFYDYDPVPKIKKYSKKEVITELKELVKSHPKKALAALNSLN